MLRDPRMANTCAAVAANAPAINTALDSLAAVVSGLRDKVDQLSARLSPVMGPESPMPCPDKKPQDAVFRVSGHIEENVRDISAEVFRLQSLIERLEV